LLTFKRRDEGALIQMGYLSAVAAVLLHATVNFLLFFAFISLLLGLYLARVDPSTVGMNTLEEVRKPSRAYGMAVAGYSLIVGYLLFGQIMVQAFLENATRVQRVLLERGALYPRYEIAYWLSIFSPFHPSPPQIMGIELANAYLLTGGGNPAIGLAALDYMDEAWRLAPCYLPFAQDSMTFVQQNRKDVILRKRGQEIAERALKCDVRYGLGYYYSGLFADSPDIAVERWRVGLENCPKQSDQWLLTAAILSVTSTTYPSKYSDLASQIAQRSLNYMDGTPNRNVDLEFWRQVEITLSHLRKR